MITMYHFKKIIMKEILDAGWLENKRGWFNRKYRDELGELIYLSLDEVKIVESSKQ